ncbi:Protein pelota [Galdieria sulphuraria]|uniref:Protein pelota homolog n=1 Tax=Galdieria sulphuraria TaxID=130081 RepID=M2Y1W6_GALSU|nr:cell division protein pelota [Galdieria sulphuraria]EME29938.1 cell division protein pelota [Galdieria sulphuraria]GJD11989.1 Protein pelota [Galdieria sulphuraria]|eukprot:XP_005706458.1 cell division protein pelota [Galdieria sulphuraria]
MKLLRKDIDKTNSGTLKLVPESSDDMWEIYNLVSTGDFVRASTIRKVQKELSSGATENERMRLFLTVQVDDTEFDAEGCELRISGRNVVENEHVKLGAHHTLVLEPHRAVSIGKESWDEFTLQRIKEACDPSATAEVAAILLQEGYALVCVVSRSLTLVKAKVETFIPRKGKDAAFNRERALSKFFLQLFQSCAQNINFQVVKVLIIASPGFVKDEFFKFFFEEAARRDLRTLVSFKSKVILCNISAVTKWALEEVLSDDALSKKLENVKALEETRALNTFFHTFDSCPEKAAYGWDEVGTAVELSAVDALFISDEIFRTSDVTRRKQIVEMVEHVKQAGGKLFVLSTMHVSGIRLKELTGIAATLRFPLPEYH